MQTVGSVGITFQYTLCFFFMLNWTFSVVFSCPYYAHMDIQITMLCFAHLHEPQRLVSDHCPCVTPTAVNHLSSCRLLLGPMQPPLLRPYLQSCCNLPQSIQPHRHLNQRRPVPPPQLKSQQPFGHKCERRASFAPTRLVVVMVFNTVINWSK